MKLTLYRATHARHVNPGDTIHHDGPIRIETVRRDLAGDIELTGRRPTRQSRRERVVIREDAEVHVLATPAEEIEAWSLLRDAIEVAGTTWRDHDTGDDRPADPAPWSPQGGEVIGLRITGELFILSQCELPEQQPEPEPEPVDPPADE